MSKEVVLQNTYLNPIIYDFFVSNQLTSLNNTVYSHSLGQYVQYITMTVIVDAASTYSSVRMRMRMWVPGLSLQLY